MSSIRSQAGTAAIAALAMLAMLWSAGCERKGIDQLAEPEVTLTEGMPHTIVLPDGNVVYDIGGDWDAVYDNKLYGINEDVVRFTQTGNRFVGVKLIGNEYMPKGSETFKGELGNPGFLAVSGMSQAEGWGPARGRIYGNGTKMMIELPIKSMDYTVIVTLSRK